MTIVPNPPPAAVAGTLYAVTFTAENAVGAVTADVSASDPTVLLFNAYYQPIFPLLYLVLTFNLRASL